MTPDATALVYTALGRKENQVRYLIDDSYSVSISEAERKQADFQTNSTSYIPKRTPGSIRNHRRKQLAARALNSPDVLRREQDEWRRRYNNTPRLVNGTQSFLELRERCRRGEILFKPIGNDRMQVVVPRDVRRLVTTHSGGEVVGTFNTRIIHRENVLQQAE